MRVQSCERKEKERMRTRPRTRKGQKNQRDVPRRLVIWKEKNVCIRDSMHWVCSSRGYRSTAEKDSVRIFSSPHELLFLFIFPIISYLSPSLPLPLSLFLSLCPCRPSFLVLLYLHRCFFLFFSFALHFLFFIHILVCLCSFTLPLSRSLLSLFLHILPFCSLPSFFFFFFSIPLPASSLFYSISPLSLLPFPPPSLLYNYLSNAHNILILCFVSLQLVARDKEPPYNSREPQPTTTTTRVSVYLLQRRILDSILPGPVFRMALRDHGVSGRRVFPVECTNLSNEPN